MSQTTAVQLARRIKEHAEKHAVPHVAIGLHGGEPLMVGASHLDTLASAFRHHLSSLNPHISVQTNATLITERICDVIRKHDIKVSMSIDGGRGANSRRVDLRNRPSFDAATRGITFAKKTIPDQVAGILAVIDIETAPLDAFDSIAQFGIKYIDFLLPHHNWDFLPPRRSTSSTEYGEWLWEIFNAWVHGTHESLSIRFFENIIRGFLGETPVCETMTLAPVSLITINTDGGLEGVDTIKSTGSSLQMTGMNIFQNSFDDVLEDPLIAMRQSGERQLSTECLACPHFKTCAGGYFPHRYSRSTGFTNPSVYCSDLFYLLDKISGYLRTARKH